MSVNKRHNNDSPEHLAYLNKIKQKEIAVRVSQIAILLAFLTLWELAASLKWIDSFITSQPTRIWNTIRNLYQTGELYRHVFVTLYETIIGFTLGTITGTAIAIVLWWSDFAAKVADPYLVVLNSLPKVALGPIIIVWMGAGTASIVTMALLVSVIVTVIGVLNGFLDVSPDKIKLLKTFGATKRQILTKVVLPASIPTIISALKINVGMSWWSYCRRIPCFQGRLRLSGSIRRPGISAGSGYDQCNYHACGSCTDVSGRSLAGKAIYERP